MFVYMLYNECVLDASLLGEVSLHSVICRFAARSTLMSCALPSFDHRWLLRFVVESIDAGHSWLFVLFHCVLLFFVVHLAMRVISFCWLRSFSIICFVMILLVIVGPCVLLFCCFRWLSCGLCFVCVCLIVSHTESVAVCLCVVLCVCLCVPPLLALSISVGKPPRNVIRGTCLGQQDHQFPGHV